MGFFKNLPEIGLEVEEDEDDELREYKGGNDDQSECTCKVSNF